MTAAPLLSLPGLRRLARAVLACGALLLAAAAPAEDRLAWTALSSAQQQALAPLAREWPKLDTVRKRKWLEVAARFATMPPDERRRVQERMAAWAALTPAERTRARLQFEETRQIGAEERQARWQAYQSLTDEERRALAQKAARKPARPASAATDASASLLAKSNVVVPPARTPRPRAVGPTVVQARPGVTTTTMSTMAAPPRHHQPGLPKIVATPGFVDPETLLPRRGPQGAAMRPAASSDPAEQP